jgi:indole-3-glycerol phosphate synthase
MSILGKIIEKKKDRLKDAKHRLPFKELKALIKDNDRPRHFGDAVRRGSGNIRFIAEIKKASPSKGLIREDFNHMKIAVLYEQKAVDAISVITEEDFFLGKWSFIPDVKKITTRPVLRKDFIVDAYQIYEARAQRADAVLLIAAVLDAVQAEEFLHIAHDLGMGVLFEVHDREELETVLKVNAPIIGINNRDLKTLRIDLGTTQGLTQEIPSDRVVVSESGITTREDVLRLEAAGVDAMLVGTSLMESHDISQKIDELRGNA